MDGMAMVELEVLENYCNGLLAVSEFEDYCPNGTQLDAESGPVQRIVSAVTASQAVIDGAAELDADLLLVHHGYFWKGEPASLVGLKGRRVGSLYRRGISLMAYHLPLDAHPRLGNNRLLAQRLGLGDSALVAEEGGLLWHTVLDAPEPVTALTERIRRALDRDPLHLPGGSESIRRLGWCSGAAQEKIFQAAALGLDAFISGEVSEQTFHLAQELGVHYFAAGHHATERFGVQALGERLVEKFGLFHQFLDISNPV
jgi:dinuclear metal center YbgI/SA1388 family protein